MPNQTVRQAANNATPWFQRHHPLCTAESTEFSKLIEFLWQICKEAAIFRTPSPVLPLLSLERWKRQAWKEKVSTILCEYKSQQSNNRWNPLLRSTVMNFVLRTYLLLLLLSPFLLNPKPQDGENGRGDENQRVSGRCTNFDGINLFQHRALSNLIGPPTLCRFSRFFRFCRFSFALCLCPLNPARFHHPCHCIFSCHVRESGRRVTGK